MSNLRDVRGRIRGVSQTLQVTKAMKLISTAKLRRARRTLEDTEPYFDRIRASMNEIVGAAGAVGSEFFDHREKNKERRSAVVVVTSDRGLAGGYNAAVARFAEQVCSGLPNAFLIVVGSVGQRYFVNSPYPVIENFTFRSKLPEVSDAKEIADFVVSQFLWEVFDEVHVVYTRMRSMVKLVPEAQRLLPLDAAGLATPGSLLRAFDRRDTDFEYIPSPEAVFDALAPLYVKGIVYGALVEAYASEQSARMAAMDEASKNAEDMLGSLRLAYNRARQSAITQEVSEIVSGAAALGN
jgi:F-type H+-transporting ATPase subunit gamma